MGTADIIKKGANSEAGKAGLAYLEKELKDQVSKKLNPKDEVINIKAETISNENINVDQDNSGVAKADNRIAKAQEEANKIARAGLNQENSRPQSSGNNQSTQPSFQQPQENIRENIEKEVRTENKIEKNKEQEVTIEDRLHSTGYLRILFLFYVSVVMDMVSLVTNISMYFVAGVDKGIETIFDGIVLVVAFFTGGKYFFMQRINLPFIKNIPPPLLEFIPWIDILPLYTFSAYKSFKAYRADRKLLGKTEADLKKSRKELKNQRAANKKEGSKFNINLNTAESQKFKRWATIVILFIIFSSVAILVFTESGPKLIHKATDSYKEIDFSFTDLMNDIRGYGLRVTDWTKTRFTRQVDIATGNYDNYAGMVDNVQKDLGLKLEIDKTDDTFFVNTPVLVYSTVTGRGFPSDVCDGFDFECELDRKIELFCSASFGGISGTMNPSVIDFDLLEDSYVNPVCRFEDGVLNEVYKKKTTNIYETAVFPFATSAYYKADFTTFEKKKELEREGTRFTKYDPVYTPGPVEIKVVEFKDSPVLVGDPSRRGAFKFQIKNIEGGSIKDFTKLAFKLPKGIVLESCNPPEIAMGNNVYEINPSIFNDVSYKLIGPGEKIEISCSMDLSSSSILDLSRPTTPDRFDILAIYNYRLIEKMPITIKKPEYITALTDCTTVCESTAGCECTGECSTNLFISKGQSCDLTPKINVAESEKDLSVEEIIAIEESS